MTRTFTTFIAPAFFATALFAGTAAEAAYVPEAERILDVVAQTGTNLDEVDAAFLSLEELRWAGHLRGV